MRRAPKKCGRDGCENRSTGRYCPDHRSRWNTTGATRTSTPEHKAWRAAVMLRDRWICQIKGPNCTRRATEADHIRNVKRGGAEFDLNNGQAACANCHREKTLREATAGRR
jgi:5-methylcytosine-specific restriction endonuclease McrA